MLWSIWDVPPRWPDESFRHGLDQGFGMQPPGLVGKCSDRIFSQPCCFKTEQMSARLFTSMHTGAFVYVCFVCPGFRETTLPVRFFLTAEILPRRKPSFSWCGLLSMRLARPSLSKCLCCTGLAAQFLHCATGVLKHNEAMLRVPVGSQGVSTCLPRGL